MMVECLRSQTKYCKKQHDLRDTKSEVGPWSLNTDHNIRIRHLTVRTCTQKSIAFYLAVVANVTSYQLQARWHGAARKIHH